MKLSNILLLIFFGQLCHFLNAQTIENNAYLVVPAPFSNAVSIASTIDQVLVVTSDGRTFVSQDAIIWQKFDNQQNTPTAICAYNDGIYGISSSGLVKWAQEEWIFLQPATGFLKTQAGMLYNYGLVGSSSFNRTLFVRRTSDVLTWESLPDFPSFGDNVGNLYDLAANESEVIVSGHSGRFIHYTGNGSWHLKNVGVSDRLYSASFHRDALVFGGTLGKIHVSSDLQNFTQIIDQPSIRHFTRFGGLTVGGGGFKLVYSNNSSDWIELSGPPISSIFQGVAFRGKLLFLGSTNGVSSLVIVSYEQPQVSIDDSDSQIVVSIERQGDALYSLQSSTDLVNWSAVEAAFKQYKEERITWILPKDLDIQFYRALIR